MLATDGEFELQVTTRPVNTLLFASLSVAESVCVPPTATVAGDGVTVTVATGTGVTVTEAVPLFPSAVAVIVTGPPGATPVTRPVLAFTVAAATLLELHEIPRPVRTFPFASFVVATSCWVAPAITLAVAGVTVTLATGTRVTVMSDVPDLPSLVAVIVAVPTPTAVTSPFASTVAAALSDDHVTVRPVRVAPAESLVTALSCWVFPTTTLAEDGVTETLATGTGVTVIVAVPLWPSLVAVIVATPKLTADTRPVLAFTVAIAGASELQATERPESTSPAESLVVAVSCSVLPDATLADSGDTVTVATGAGNGVTEIVAVPDFPSLVAVIVADPVATAVTSPFASTVAAAVLLEDHVIVRPVRALLLESVVVAVNCCVVPVTMLAAEGFTVTVATAGGAAATRVPPSQSSTVTVLPYTPTPGAPPGSDESVMLPIATPFL
jgi:hypothetical protein